jgi:hypothetical protein
METKPQILNEIRNTAGNSQVTIKGLAQPAQWQFAGIIRRQRAGQKWHDIIWEKAHWGIWFLEANEEFETATAAGTKLGPDDLQIEGFPDWDLSPLEGFKHIRSVERDYGNAWLVNIMIDLGIDHAAKVMEEMNNCKPGRRMPGR